MADARSASEPALLGGVLIGGRSSRMGVSKADLLRSDGQTQLEHAIGCLRPYCDSILISASLDAPISLFGCHIVRDTAAYQGPATGIAQLLLEAQQRNADGLLVVAVDLPSLEAIDLKPLVAAWSEQPNKITAATFDGQFPEPLVTIYPSDYVDQLTRLANGRDRSITRWLRRTPHQAIPIRNGAGRDVDTPEQWQSFRQ